MTLNTTIDGNPGAALIGLEAEGEDWQPGIGTLRLERFIFDPQSATEGQLEVCVGTFDGRPITASVELTYADLVDLRNTLNRIIVRVVEDGRVPQA